MKKNTIDKITDSKTLSAIITVKFFLSIVSGIVGFIVFLILLSNFSEIRSAVMTENYDNATVPYLFTESVEDTEITEAKMREHETAVQESTQRSAELQEQYNAAYEQFQATKDTIMTAQGSQGHATTTGEATNSN